MLSVVLFRHFFIPGELGDSGASSMPDKRCSIGAIVKIYGNGNRRLVIRSIIDKAE